MRICTRCGKDFKETKTDTMRICRECNCERVKNKPLPHKMYNRAQQRAKRKGLELTIKPSDITIPEYCPVLGFKLKSYVGKVGGEWNSPSLDRIDNTVGYTPENIIVISQLANRMKLDASPELLLKFADWIYSTYNREESNESS